ncbi:hypothetical protein SYNPS1DRAFT_28200 [Syncephalis pseudoplumigaleata]|uniref:Uncharacterized protein n=1 Tax=Syncephalis pseudoplumigaleata TaxID=1712513 RepID=A0A4P9Z3J3_9FUNG|nr:hypothetical protein SYNPS1DRAFT_28200 [Syncephalis pseudoplumigaleata]|eukprot:RKP26090.1 hypothetical protein SYNPS1DRAFT_28200 [Syncephalis pseudoplumigaleata]
MASVPVVSGEGAAVDMERDRHTILWQATVHVNPSLLLPLGIEADVLNVCLGELAELTGRHRAMAGDAASGGSARTNTRGHEYGGHLPDGQCSAHLPHGHLLRRGHGHSQYAMLLHVTSQSRLRWETTGKMALNPFDQTGKQARQRRGGYAANWPHSRSNAKDETEEEDGLCIKAEWLHNYDAFINLCDYIDHPDHTTNNSNINSSELLAPFESWWDSMSMSSAHSRVREASDASILVPDAMAEYAYLEHVSAQRDKEAANAAKTPASIRKRLSKRDRTIMQRLTDRTTKSSTATRTSTPASSRSSSISGDVKANAAMQSAVDRVNAENIKNSNHKVGDTAAYRAYTQLTTSYRTISHCMRVGHEEGCTTSA